MNPSEKKSDRLAEIEQMLLAHPEGLNQADIARRLNVHRSTINRYIANLPGHIYIDDFDQKKWKVDRQAYLVNVRFTLDEAMAVHLATRLLATRMDKQNPHAASALRKLGSALERLAPRISWHLKQSADAMDDPERGQDPNFLRSLETITQAWSLQYYVHLWYRPENGELKEYDLAPYFIEPYAIGQSIHTIGWSSPPDALRTFKVERIERIEQTKEPYEIPGSFNPEELLKDAWGIWYTDKEPVEVVLKFQQRVARRVRETRWHRSEQVVELEDGSLLWRAWIAEPQEMLPWIRGWGADVEVLEPETVRLGLIEEVKKLAERYGIKEI
jgi:predicted DNA-binding transcriptional regulator YafY